MGRRMGRRMGSMKHPTDWERQREQLSAYLDGELSAAEHAALERHLPGCAECRAELVELRRVRALLGALPTPALPRSFALPTSGGTRPRPPMSANREPIRPSRPAWYRASQWAGSIAASIGFFLLVGSALLGGLSGPRIGVASTSQRNSALGSAQPTRVAAPTQQSPRVQNGPAATNTPPADRGQSSPTPPPTPATQYEPSPPDHDELPFVPLTGAGLLTGGLALLVVGRVAGRRR